MTLLLENHELRIKKFNTSQFALKCVPCMTYLLMYLEFLVSFNKDLPSMCSGIVIPAMSRIVGARSIFTTGLEIL